VANARGEDTGSAKEDENITGDDGSHEYGDGSRSPGKDDEMEGIRKKENKRRQSRREREAEAKKQSQDRERQGKKKQSSLKAYLTREENQD
jgi:hypothetical protein